MNLANYALMLSKVGFSAAFRFFSFIALGFIINLILCIAYLVSRDDLTVTNACLGIVVGIAMMVLIVLNARSLAINTALGVVVKQFKIPFCDYLGDRVSDQIIKNKSLVSDVQSLSKRPVSLVQGSWPIRLIANYFLKKASLENTVRALQSDVSNQTHEQMKQTISGHLVAHFPEPENTRGMILFVIMIALYAALFVFM